MQAARSYIDEAHVGAFKTTAELENFLYTRWSLAILQDLSLNLNTPLREPCRKLGSGAKHKRASQKLMVSWILGNSWAPYQVKGGCWSFNYVCVC
jgi:hypothetical protein